MLSIGAISLAAFFYGLGMVYSKQSFQDMKSFDLAIGQQLGASIILLPFALLDIPYQMPSMGVIISVFTLAILCTSVVYLLFFYLVKNIGSTKTASVTLLVPIFGIIWGVLFLDEQTTLSTYIGLIVILMSIFLVSNTKQKVANSSKQIVK
ncbi:DMT family transporter [Metabacillus idriensis]|uniref:DMT family transporter n=1 Tax=Metabacillus idriensis TaxID=324768 RepID=UPI003D294AAB